MGEMKEKIFTLQCSIHHIRYNAENVREKCPECKLEQNYQEIGNKMKVKEKRK